ncbi:MAG: SufD family Fe-S cluster assembly protein, partial [Candidatus Latescibacteria bacterium]|nr:SufD family Fe-S cluster assembly protein [Candidatus Latescibacterota bacterium]
MATQTVTPDHYIDAFKQFEQSLNGKSNTPVHSLRKEAISQFAELGFPTTRDEDWSHTSVAPITRVPYRFVGGAPSGRPSADPTAGFAFAKQWTDAVRLVFVNGHLSPEHSQTAGLPDGVRIESLASVLESGDDLVHDQLGRHAPYREHPFAALNTAFISDGALIHVPDGVALETPVHVVYYSTLASDEPSVSHPRTLVLIGANSQATVVESYTGEGAYFTNSVTEVVAGAGGVVDHYKLGLESDEAHHVATMQTRQGRDSKVSTHSISLGGRLVRNDINALLAGEGSDAII